MFSIVKLTSLTLAFPLLCNHRRFRFGFKPLPAIMLAIVLLSASVSGEATDDGVINDGAANDANFLPQRYLLLC